MQVSPFRRWHLFPLRYAAWRGRMAWNLITGKRELLALSGVMALSGLLGLVFWWILAERGLTRVMASSTAQATLEIAFFAAGVAFMLMALARVLSGFFSQGRAAEREMLLGPISPLTLYLTEVLDALFLPGVLALLAGGVPLVRAGAALGMPLEGLIGLGLSVLLLGSLPTLLVLILTIGGMRLIPRRWLGRQGLLFLFFFAVSAAGAGALGLVREALREGGTEVLSLMPTAAVAAMLPGWQRGTLSPTWQGLFGLGVGFVGLLGAGYGLYRFAFLPHPEQFASQVDASDRAGLTEPDGRLRALLRRFFSGSVVALVLKDLRSARRDTATRLAFTGLLAFLLALAGVDILLERMNAVVLLPILWAYAVFLVSCQALSTFSAEGGVLEGLATLPFRPEDVLKAKVISHALLFAGLNLGAVGVFIVAPSPMSLWIRGLLGVLSLFLLLPLGGLLALITVTLGAVFPKPGAGGGRKEISVFAMALFGQLVGMGGLSLAGAVGAPVIGGGVGLLVPLTVGPAWWLVLALLWGLALRAIDRALGASMKLG